MATGGLANGSVNGFGSLLDGIRLSSADWPDTTRDSGNDSAAPAKTPALTTSLRVSDMTTPDPRARSRLPRPDPDRPLRPPRVSTQPVRAAFDTLSPTQPHVNHPFRGTAKDAISIPNTSTERLTPEAVRHYSLRPRLRSWDRVRRRFRRPSVRSA